MATPTPGVIKRTACDRCHGQKMRCIRDSYSTSPKCNRCITANAECNFSPARKAGRPPSSKQSRSSIATKPQPDQDTEELQRWNASPSQSMATFSTSSTSMRSRSSSGDNLSTGITSFEPMPTPGESPDSSMLLSSASDFEIPDLDFAWKGMDPGQDMEGLWLDTHLDLDLDPASEALHQEMEAAVTLNPGLGSNLGSTYDEQMQKLAVLSGKLFTQINQHQDEGTPMENIDLLTGHVISSSSALLDILKCLRDTIAQQHTTTTMATETDSPMDTATTLHVLSAYIRLTQLHYKLYRRIHALVSTPTPHYSATSHLYTSTSQTPGSMSSPLSTFSPTFSTLEIGGISLAPYSRFQLKFLLQICVHHLGEIEVMLGLPVGFRVSEVESSGSEAGLGEILSGGKGRNALLMQAIMMGSGTPVKEIAETLERLKKALEGRIQV